MRLEIDSIAIKDLKESSTTSVKDGVLNVNLKELEELILKDIRIKSVDLNIVHPGEKTRMINVQDVVQPRYKVDGSTFPGFADKIALVGEGKTISLDGVAVVLSNATTTRVETGVLDMSGPAADLTPYAKMQVVSITGYTADGIPERDYEFAIKCASMKAAKYLAEAAKDCKPDNVEVFESEVGVTVDPKLPRVAYFFQVYTPQFDYKAVSDNVIYGTMISHKLPTIMHPNEILDGAIMGWDAMKAIDSYCNLNNGMIKELYKHHGKDLNFVGVIVAPANTDADSRTRCAVCAANLAKNVLHADGCLLSKILGGMPHADISTTAVLMEKMGVKTASPTTPLTATGTLADTILYNDIELDLIYLQGAPFERTTRIPFKAEKILGGIPHTKLYCPLPVPQFADDAVIGLEQYLIPGVHDHTGNRKIIVKEF
jgi:glycine reductase complex component B subunit alpha and beta